MIEYCYFLALIGCFSPFKAAALKVFVRINSNIGEVRMGIGLFHCSIGFWLMSRCRKVTITQQQDVSDCALILQGTGYIISTCA